MPKYTALTTFAVALVAVTGISCAALFAERNPDELNALVVDACRVRLATGDATGVTPIDPEIRKACAAIIAASEQE